ncbi:hypothetical protein CLU79DRAFT_765443 [Phycomyces nitens]|nr:hypothetical protein CLU79DRAFT_765443 [Phycomyces nitens]
MSIPSSVNHIAGVPVVASQLDDLLKCSCVYCIQLESFNVNIDSNIPQAYPMEELLLVGPDLLQASLPITYPSNSKPTYSGHYPSDTFSSECSEVPFQDQFLVCSPVEAKAACGSWHILQDDLMSLETDEDEASNVPAHNLDFQEFLNQFLQEDPCLYNLVDQAPGSRASWSLESMSSEPYQPQPLFVTSQQYSNDSPDPFTPSLSTSLSIYDSPMPTDRSITHSMNEAPNNMFMPFYELKSTLDYASNSGKGNDSWLHQLLQDPVIGTSSRPKSQGRKRGSTKDKSSDRIKKHVCCFCSYKTDRVSNFIRHVESHTRCTNEWECKLCAISFSSKSNLARHNRRTRH